MGRTDSLEEGRYFLPFFWKGKKYYILIILPAPLNAFVFLFNWGKSCLVYRLWLVYECQHKG